MSDGAIISREMIRNMARSAFAAGRSRDSHGMNAGAEARTTWLHEYDRLSASFSAATSHPTAASTQRVEEAQVSA